MLDKSEGQQVSEDYLHTVDLIIQKLKGKGQFHGESVTVKVGKKPIFMGIIDEKTRLIDATKEDIKVLRSAIDNPQKSSKSVQIIVTGKPVFHAEVGHLLKDNFKLSSNVELTNNLKSISELVQEIPVNIEQLMADNRNDTKELAQALNQQTQASNRLIEKLDKMSGISMIHLQQVKNNRLGKWLNNVSMSIQNAAQDAKKSLANKVAQFTGRVVTAAVKKMLDWVGEKHPDGSRSFSSDSFQYLENSKGIHIETKDHRPILNAGSLAPTATNKDLNKLSEVSKKVQSIEQSQSHQKTVGRAASLVR